MAAENILQKVTAELYLHAVSLLILFTAALPVCWWPAVQEVIVHIWSHLVIALLFVQPPIQLQVVAGLTHDLVSQDQ